MTLAVSGSIQTLIFTSGIARVLHVVSTRMHSFYNQNCYGSNGYDPFCEPALATSVSLSAHVQTPLLKLNASAQSDQEPGLSGSSFGFRLEHRTFRRR